MEDRPIDESAMLEEPNQKDSLQLKLLREYKRAGDLSQDGMGVRQVSKPPITAATDDDYKTECAVLPKEVFHAAVPFPHPNAPDDGLDTLDFLKYFHIPRPDSLPRDFDEYFPQGHTFCLSAFPFKGDGFGKDDLTPKSWADFLKEDKFMKRLAVDPKDNLTSGFNEYGGYIYDHLCARLKADVSEGGCSFKLEYPGPPGDYGNRDWFVRQFIKAYNNLVRFLNEPTEAQKKKLLN